MPDTNTLPILTIAIPTYNRHACIKDLYLSFLSKVAENFANVVEVIVCDNSDDEQAQLNQETLADSKINYIKNSENLGFSGNIAKCFGEAEGRFVWIISDDDEVDLESFIGFLGWLEKENLDGFNGIMIPFYNTKVDGTKYLMNTSEQWGDSKVSEMIKQESSIPFILFSGVVVRNAGLTKDSILEEIGNSFKGNDYIQVPLFMSIIGKEGSVCFYDKPLQEYQPAAQGRFSLMGLVDSLEKVIGFITHFYDYPETEKLTLYYKSNYKRWMQWMMLHKAGIYEIKGADRVIWSLLWKWRREHFYSFRNLAIAVFCMLPKPLAKVVYKLK